MSQYGLVPINVSSSTQPSPSPIGPAPSIQSGAAQVVSFANPVIPCNNYIPAPGACFVSQGQFPFPVSAAIGNGVENPVSDSASSGVMAAAVSMPVVYTSVTSETPSAEQQFNGALHDQDDSDQRAQ